MEPSITNAALLLSCLLISPAAGHDCWGGHHCDDDWHCNRHGGSAAAQPQSGVAPSRAATAPKTVDGKISEIIYLPGATADSAMVEVRVLAGGQATLVRLAPVGLLKQSRVALREGDAVSVTGFEVSGMEGDLLVAAEIRKGGQRLVLRDPDGRPVW